ncbi:MAG: S24/S26 family peptidase [Oscillospiraceae bacterium]|nr:S24/S26 family peptidase [Oscillospiraceae bacterium]
MHSKKKKERPQEHFAELDTLMPLIRESLAAGKSVRFSPRGISMLPMLRQGLDSVVLSPLPEKLRRFDLPLYRRDDGKYVLHRIVEADSTYTCIGDNQFEMEHGLRYDQMIALVTVFYRGEKRISVTNPGYRMYCCLWHFSRPLRHFWRRGKGWLRRHILK